MSKDGEVRNNPCFPATARVSVWLQMGQKEKSPRMRGLSLIQKSLKARPVNLNLTGRAVGYQPSRGQASKG